MTNRALGPLGDVIPPWMWVEHRGRNSGRTYRTPVWAWRAGAGYVIALTYGAETEWLKNVLAAEGCRLEQRGRSVKVGNPRVVSPEIALAYVPGGLRPLLRALRIKTWLLLDR